MHMIGNCNSPKIFLPPSTTAPEGEILQPTKDMTGWGKQKENKNTELPMRVGTSSEYNFLMTCIFCCVCVLKCTVLCHVQCERTTRKTVTSAKRRALWNSVASVLVTGAPQIVGRKNWSCVYVSMHHGHSNWAIPFFELTFISRIVIALRCAFLYRLDKR